MSRYYKICNLASKAITNISQHVWKRSYIKKLDFVRPSACAMCLPSPELKPCFDINNVYLEFGTPAHANLIKWFLNTHYWLREPLTICAYMDPCSPYIQLMNDKYALQGVRIIAYEKIPRTGERRIIGFICGSKLTEAVIKEYSQWSHSTSTRAERAVIQFMSHCLTETNLFKKYHVDSIFLVEVLATASEVSSQGVGQLLLYAMLQHELEARHPYIMMIATNAFAQKICERCEMTKEWTFPYLNLTDVNGNHLLCPRRPHTEAVVYIKKFDNTDMTNPGEKLCKRKLKGFRLFNNFKVHDYGTYKKVPQDDE